MNWSAPRIGQFGNDQVFRVSHPCGRIKLRLAAFRMSGDRGRTKVLIGRKVLMVLELVALKLKVPRTREVSAYDAPKIGFPKI